MSDTSSVDDRMGAAIADGSYWGNDALQAEVRDAAARGVETSSRDEVVSSSGPSSLSQDAMATGRVLEDMMTDPKSEYWVGPRAAEFQALYRDLVRGELAGEAGPVRPEHSGDVDVPAKASAYQLDGLHIFHAQDRDIVDTFARQAHDSAFGNERFRSCVSWGLQQSGPPSQAEFRKWALGENWSDAMIKRAIDIYEDMRKRA